MGSNLRPSEFNSRLSIPSTSSSNTNSNNNYYLSDQLLPLGFSMNPEALMMRNAAQRQREKERIREEIIAEEILRRRELEMEVRRELAMERELALRRAEALTMTSMTLPGFLPPPAQVGDLGNMPFQRPPVLADLGNGHVGKVVFLAKPTTSSNISGKNGKVFTVGDKKFTVTGTKKKHKEWGCALCKVSASSEQALNDHLQGKKHIERVAELKANKAAKKKTSSSTLLEKKTKGTTEDKRNTGDPKSKQGKKQWSCTLCQVSTTGEQGLNDHLRGKSHKAKEAEQMANKTTDNPPKSYNVWQKRTDKQEAKPVTEDVNKDQSNFWCQDCNVRCSSEIDMAGHQTGKKHMARLEAQKQNFATVDCLGTSDTSEKGVGSEETKREATENAGGDVHAMKKVEMETKKALDQTEASENKTFESIKHESSIGNPSPELGKRQEEKLASEDLKKNFIFWCEDCQVRCHCETDIASHLKGKKHMARLQTQKKIDSAVPFGTSNNNGTSKTGDDSVGRYEKVIGVMDGEVHVVGETEEKVVKALDSIVNNESGGEATDASEKETDESIKYANNTGFLSPELGGKQEEKLAPEDMKKRYVIWLEHGEKKEEKLTLEDLKKKFKFWCEDCQIGCPSEVVMRCHLKKKKHMARLCTHEEKCDAFASATSPSQSQLLPKKFQFWCEDCLIGCQSEVIMDCHLKGKKHTAQLRVQKEKCAAVASETTPSGGTCGKAGFEERLEEAIEIVDGKVHVVGDAEEEGVKALDSTVNNKSGGEATEALENLTDEDIKNANSSQVPSLEHGDKKEGKLTIEELKKKFKFWCEDCQVGCHSEVVMGGHLKGKKHMARLRVQKEKCAAAVASATTPNGDTYGKAGGFEERFEEALEDFDWE